MIQEINASALDGFIRDKNEKDYVIIDVRQYEEYCLDHIPGASHIPLAQIQFDPFVFEDERILMFYCTRGNRSKVAAMIVAEAGYDENNLYLLKGGILEYTGRKLPDMPRVDLFPTDVSPMDIIQRSMDLEKGACLFYGVAQQKLKGSRLYPVMEKMGRAEISHARAIYHQMKTHTDVQVEFQTVFDSLTGGILEGGRPLEEIEKFLAARTSDLCIDILDFAIELEFSAYDLYRTLAENFQSKDLGQMFFKLAQAEKKHLEILIQSLALCDKAF